MNAIEQHEAALLRALVRFSRGQRPSGPGISYQALVKRGWLLQLRPRRIILPIHELTPEGKRIVKLASERQES